MLKTKNYKYGNIELKAYIKTVGHGFELGLFNGRKPIFVGNFINKNEAARLWGILNIETRSFLKRYWVGKTVQKAWYCNFLSDHLYKSYYIFLDRVFSQRGKVYVKSFHDSVRKYSRMKKNWHHTDALKLKVA